MQKLERRELIYVEEVTARLPPTVSRQKVFPGINKNTVGPTVHGSASDPDGSYSQTFDINRNQGGGGGEQGGPSL